MRKAKSTNSSIGKGSSDLQYTVVPFLFITFLSLSGFTTASSLKIHYPDRQHPGKKPLVFAPDLVSSNEHEFGCCFSPDGKEFYFTRAVGRYKKKNVLFIKYNGKNWSQPEKAISGFTGEAYEPHVTSDAQKLYFMGMVIQEKEGKFQGIMDLYYAEKEKGLWSKITHLAEPFNPLRSMFLSSTFDGLLFTTNRSGKGPDIVYVKQENGTYSDFLDPGPTINTDQPELYPFIARDGSYLLFNRISKEGKHLFVSFKNRDGSWGEAHKVNLGMESGCPMVSPDGKYLFFNSGRKFQNDIFWVNSDVFFSLKQNESSN